MTLREQLKAALDRAREIAEAAKSEDREFTDEEITEITNLKAQADELGAKVKAADDAQAAVAAMAGTSADAPEGPAPAVHPDGGEAKSFGEAFVKSGAYDTFRKAHPSGFGQGTPIQIDRVKVGDLSSLRRGYKATEQGNTLQTDLAQLQPTRLPMVDLTVQQPLTLLDLISRGSIGGPSFEYLQVTAVTRNAGIVKDEILPDDADSELKPTSDLSTNLADAKVYTYADGYTVTNMMLADAPALASYLNGQLAYNINNVIEDKILNGTGTNGEPTGILHTTGVQQQDVASDDPQALVEAVRKAITKLQNIGAPITGLVMSPEDSETIDLMRDGMERYYGQGPFGMGPNTLWGRPRAISQRLTAGQFIIGNLATVTLLDREGLSVLAFNQHKDYAQRNLVYVRAELRAAQAIFQPAQLVVGTVAGG